VEGNDLWLIVRPGDGSSMRVVATHVRRLGGDGLLIERESDPFQTLVRVFWMVSWRKQ
jgi:hypothetical protein